MYLILIEDPFEFGCLILDLVVEVSFESLRKLSFFKNEESEGSNAI